MLFTLVAIIEINLHEDNFVQRKWHSCRDEKGLY